MGATLTLAYPPEKEEHIPAALRERLLRLSPLYLHFQLYAFEQSHDPEAVAHLEHALDEKGYEKLWEQWSHNLPFDTEVNAALARIMENRLSKVDRKKDPALFQKHENKLRLIKDQVARHKKLRLSDHRL